MHYEKGEMMEIWKDVVGYEDYYQVSSLGRVRSKDRYYGTEHTKQGPKFRPGRVLQLQDVRDGYKTAALSVDGHVKLCRVHRLVAEAFLDNPNRYPEVNHKDEVRDHNWVDNLEWCTRKYNHHYGNCIQRSAEGKKKPVVSISPDGKRTWYPSATDAARQEGFNKSNISACCRGVVETYRGLRWELA